MIASYCPRGKSNENKQWPKMILFQNLQARGACSLYIVLQYEPAFLHKCTKQIKRWMVWSPLQASNYYVKKPVKIYKRWDQIFWTNWRNLCVHRQGTGVSSKGSLQLETREARYHSGRQLRSVGFLGLHHIR